MQFDYFYGNEAEQFTFYRIPKVLVSSPQFRQISDSAKLLYGLMLDRMSLSIRNGWFDEKNRAYIFFTIKDIMELMCCATEKATKITAELDNEKGIGLIERVKQGQGKPAKIYLKKFISDSEDYSEKSRVSEIESQDFGNPKTQTFENRKSRVSTIESADFRQSKCNNTDNNYTDFNDTDLSNIHSVNQSENERWIDRYNKTVAQIKEQIDYDALIATNSTELVNDIVEVMADVMLVDTTYYTIGKKEIPAEMVRIRFGQLTFGKIEALLLDLDDVTWTIHSKPPYLISALYNASTTAETSIQNRVKHDMYSMCRRE